MLYCTVRVDVVLGLAHCTCVVVTLMGAEGDVTVGSDGIEYETPLIPSTGITIAPLRGEEPPGPTVPPLKKAPRVMIPKLSSDSAWSVFADPMIPQLPALSTSRISAFAVSSFRRNIGHIACNE
jgi:hypothetical protein